MIVHIGFSWVIQQHSNKSFPWIPIGSKFGTQIWWSLDVFGDVSVPFFWGENLSYSCGPQHPQQFMTPATRVICHLNEFYYCFKPDITVERAITCYNCAAWSEMLRVSSTGWWYQLSRLQNVCWWWVYSLGVLLPNMLGNVGDYHHQWPHDLTEPCNGG